MRKKERLISTTAISLTIVFLAVAWFWLVPLVEQKNIDYKTLQADITKYEEGVTNLNLAKGLIDNAGSINGLPITEEKLLQTLPFSEEKEDIYALIESMAATAGITEPISMGVNSTSLSESGVELIPITLATKGSYGNLTAFIALFQNSLRPVIINSLDIFPTEDGGLSLSISASAYSLTSSNVQDTAAIESNVPGENFNNDIPNSDLVPTTNLQASSLIGN